MKKKILILVGITLLLSASFVYAQEETKELEVNDFIYNDNNRRDPLWPLVEAGGVIVSYDTEFLVSDLSLEGIVFQGEGKSVAIINGKVVRVNDMIGKYLVYTITTDKVVLIKDNKSYELKLKKGE